MSGLEIAGVVLGAFPIIISGLENWHKASVVGEIIFSPDIERRLCLIDFQFEKIRYTRSLEALLIPLADEKRQVDEMVNAASSPHWKDTKLNDRLRDRLGESYETYMDIMSRMNETAEAFQEKLGGSQRQSSTSTNPIQHPQSTTNKLFTTLFSKSDTRSLRSRVTLGVGRSARLELFARLKECNERLEILLRTSDEISKLKRSTYGPPKISGDRRSGLVESRKQAVSFFKALQHAWQCQCPYNHIANLKVGYPTTPELFFDLILMFTASIRNGPVGSWSWRRMQCGPVLPCGSANSQTASNALTANPLNASTAQPQKRGKVAFVDSQTSPSKTLRVQGLNISYPSVQLCHQLSNLQDNDCLGIIGHSHDVFHMHPDKQLPITQEHNAVSLDEALSAGQKISRRQRASIAVALAIAVAQLRLTPWLGSAITKKDIYFFPSSPGATSDFGEPFIRQEVAAGQGPIVEAKDSVISLNSLGIILLELCFNMRIEDHSSRKLMPAGTPDEESAMDRIVAKKWVDDVFEESGSDYEQAVEWCLKNRVQGMWPQDFVTNVLEPLELCKEYIWRK
jgi:hypothetical protein